MILVQLFKGQMLPIYTTLLFENSLSYLNFYHMARPKGLRVYFYQRSKEDKCNGPLKDI